MTIDERYKYLRIRQRQYGKDGRQECSQILDEMEQVTGLDRKTLARHMHSRIERKPLPQLAQSRRARREGPTCSPDRSCARARVAQWFSCPGGAGSHQRMAQRTNEWARRRAVVHGEWHIRGARQSRPAPFSLVQPLRSLLPCGSIPAQVRRKVTHAAMAFMCWRKNRTRLTISACRLS